MTETQVRQALVQETYAELEAGPIGAEFREEGIAIPTTRAELKELASKNPYLAIKFEQAFVPLFNKNAQEVKAYYATLAEAETVNQAAVESNKTKIKAHAAEAGIKVTDAELNALVEKAGTIPGAWTEKNGVKMLTGDGLARHWLLEKYDTLVKAREVKAELRGRTQAAEDLKKAKQGSDAGIGSANLGGVTRSTKAPVNYSDPGQIAALSDEELEKALRGPRP
jgi:hypothetical protein